MLRRGSLSRLWPFGRRSSLGAKFYCTTSENTNHSATTTDGDQQPARKGLVVAEPSPALDGVAIVSLNSPPVNTLTTDLMSELFEVMTDQAKDDNIRGIVLTSAVPNVFSAGLDLRLMHGEGLQQEPFVKYWTLFQDIWIMLNSFHKPIIASIGGQCPAAGCILALGCDYRVMARGPDLTSTHSSNGEAFGHAKKKHPSHHHEYRIGISAVKAGFRPPSWVFAGMEHVIGTRTTERLLTTGAQITADAALNCGLVDEVADTPEEAIVAAHVELEKWLAMQEHTRWIVKEHCRADLNSMLDSREKRTQDTADFFLMMKEPTVQKQLSLYFDSLKQKKHQKK